MNIRELHSTGHQEHNRLSMAYGSVFDSLHWTNLFGNAIKNYGIYSADNKLIGGFFTYTDKKYGISICRNPPLTSSIGPFLKIESTNPVRVMEKHKQVISSIAEFMDTMNYSVISLAFHRDMIDMQPFIWREFKVIPQYTYILPLAMPLEDIWKGMSNERRNDISKATRDRLTATKTNNYTLVRSLVLKTFLRQNRVIDDAHINKVLFEFANDDNSFAFAVLHDEVPISCAFCVRDGKTAYYLLGGYDAEGKHHGAGALCVWEAIKYSKHLELTYFDFEGSMVPRIERYFRGFGGRLIPYYRVNKAKLPLELALKFFKRELF